MEDNNEDAEPAPYVDTCAACGTQEPPNEKGLCPNPSCKRIRKGAKLASKGGPVNTTRRKELREALERDYRPVSTIDRSRCRLLANICERLEVAKTGTQEHQRMIQSQSMLVEVLSASLTARQAAALAAGRLAVETMTMKQLEIRLQALEKIRRYRRQQIPVEQLLHAESIAELKTLVSQLEAMTVEGSTQQPQVQQPSVDDSESDIEDSEDEDEDLIEDPDALQAHIARQEQELAEMKQQLAQEQQPQQPKPEPVACAFCYLTLQQCADMQTTRPEDWSAIHYNHPDEVRKRDEQATAEMFESMRRNRK